MESLVFYFLSSLIVTLAILVVIQGRVLYSVFFLTLFMLAVSGLFFSLSAYFLAGVQILIYAGAFFAFFIMIFRSIDFKKISKKRRCSFLFPKMLILGCFFGFLLAIVNKTLYESFFVLEVEGGSLDEGVYHLFSNYFLEILVCLLLAIFILIKTKGYFRVE